MRVDETDGDDVTLLPENGIEPRVLKKRSKKVRLSDRRSKSVEHRRRQKVAKMQPRSKDDLDFGTFTVIGRPPNPWTLENNLKRGKSLPNMVEASNPTDFNTNQLSGVETESEKHAADSKAPPPSSKKTQTITVQSSNYEVQASSNSTSLDYQGTSSVKVNVVAGKKPQMELTSKTMTELNVGELKRYFQECLITIKTSKMEKYGDVIHRQSDLHRVDDLTESFENLVEIIGNMREDILLPQLSLAQLHPPPQPQPKKIRIDLSTDVASTVIVGNSLDSLECSTDLFQDFLRQLIPDASPDKFLDESDVDEGGEEDEGEDEPGFRTMIGKCCAFPHMFKFVLVFPQSQYFSLTAVFEIFVVGGRHSKFFEIAICF